MRYLLALALLCGCIEIGSEGDMRRWEQQKEGILDREFSGAANLSLANPRQVLLNVSGDDDTARVMGVQIGIIPSTEQAEIRRRVTAIVEWGTAGAFHRAIIDVGLGVSFNLVASSIKIEVVENTPLVNIIKVNASVSYYPVAQAISPTFTEEVPLGAAATSGAIQRPNFATQVEIERGDGATAFFFDALSVTGLAYRTTVAAGAKCPTVPLANGVRSIAITDAGAGGTYFVVWRLAL